MMNFHVCNRYMETAKKNLTLFFQRSVIFSIKMCCKNEHFDVKGFI